MAQHVATVDQYFTDESLARDSKPKATFVVGQLCAGKTTYRKKHCVRDFVLVDAGDVYMKLNNGSWADFGKNMVSEMKQVCFAIAARAVMQQRNIVCELVVDSEDVVKVFQAVQDGLTELGYSISIVDIDCDLETAKKRNATRQTDNISSYYTTGYVLKTFIDVMRVKKCGELESGVCDVCGTRVRNPEGHLLTTRQVVGCPGYWEKVYGQQRESLQLRGVSSFEDLKKNPEVRTELAERFATETTPWMVCGSCISTFPVDAGATHLHAKRWWECVAVYDLPGVGAVPLSAVDMGDGLLSAETKPVASGTAHKTQRRWWEFWKNSNKHRHADGDTRTQEPK
ncbi:AAA family ATPase [candidate division CSSED10-310 bacterium]|uniref:AAA family ATPase n=1 Tax=candidate division CSSED10-310 bacterium TaxID=2855610 RepID=A0ABV6Z3H6_UNCC1